VRTITTHCEAARILPYRATEDEGINCAVQGLFKPGWVSSLQCAVAANLFACALSIRAYALLRVYFSAPHLHIPRPLLRRFKLEPIDIKWTISWSGPQEMLA